MSPVYETPATAPAVKRPGANGHPCNEACGWARGPATACTCICGGARHGSFIATPAQIAMARARIGALTAIDPFLGAAATDDEEW